jgi:hypothetical protein
VTPLDGWKGESGGKRGKKRKNRDKKLRVTEGIFTPHSF